MTATTLELIDCADEPIRVPGAIQPHGWLVAVDSGSETPLAWSANWRDLIELGSPAALQGVVDALRPRALSIAAGEGPAAVGTLAVGGRLLDVTMHRVGALLMIELEGASAESGTQAPIYELVRNFLPRLQAATSIRDIAALATLEIKRLTGFGRCMAYEFDAEGNGKVLAEALDSGYDSYAAHWFPGADIPAQARALYRLNHLRLIPDAHYEPVPLVGARAGWDSRSLDLSFASLRSVSPVHLEYMRNMGTLASMSVSIVVAGRLWGLVSCHNHTPRHLPFQTRVACEHLGRLISLQIEAREDTAEVALRLELKKLTLDLVSRVVDTDATLQRLVGEPGLMRLARAGGAAVVLDGECWTIGQTPRHEEVRALAEWIAERDGEVFETDALASVFPAATRYPDCAAGVLAISLSQVHRHVILWFRAEIVQTVQWAGEPVKTPGAGGHLHPRTSFASWQQLVRGHCAPWLAAESAGVLDLRQALLGIVLRRAQERAEVATELRRANAELEAFSYTVSHDLRAPMRQIAGYVDLVLDTEGEKLSERAHRHLGQVKEASTFAGQLVDALLDFSHLGRSALQRSPVDTEKLVDALIAEMTAHDPGRHVEWSIERPLPGLWADPFLMQLAVRNLFGNALKYSRGRETTRIRVVGLSRPEGAGLEISDNGVGFQMKYVAKLFGVFQRLHHADEFEGTGIGLANVHRIVERHGGLTWARGETDVGATFGFTLPGEPVAAPPARTARTH